MNSGRMTVGAVDPLSKEQRQRVECMTFARVLAAETTQYGQPKEGSLDTEALLRVTDYLVTGAL